MERDTPKRMIFSYVTKIYHECFKNLNVYSSWHIFLVDEQISQINPAFPLGSKFQPKT